MDTPEHVYVVDTETLMVELGRILRDRGYQFSRTRQPGRWRIRTQMSRDAAYGEIGSGLQTLLGLTMMETDSLTA